MPGAEVNSSVTRHDLGQKGEKRKSVRNEDVVCSG